MKNAIKSVGRFPSGMSRNLIASVICGVLLILWSLRTPSYSRDVSTLSPDVLIPLVGPAVRRHANTAGIYQRQDKSIVMAYDLNMTHNGRVFFISNEEPIFVTTKNSFRLAQVPGALPDFERMVGLHMLPFTAMNPVFALGGKTSYVFHDVSPVCQWPFDSAIRIELTDSRQASLMFFKHLDAVVTKKYLVGCRSNVKYLELSMHYEQLVPIMTYFNDYEGNIIFFNQPPFALMINYDGTEVPGHFADGIKVVNARESVDLASQMDSGALSPRKALGQFESRIASAYWPIPLSYPGSGQVPERN